MGCDKMVSEHFDPRQQMVWSDSVGWYTPSRIPNPFRSLAADRPYSSPASARRPWPFRSIASSSRPVRPSSLSCYGGGSYRQELGVIGLGSSACKIPSRFQSESALEPHLPRQIPDSSDLRRRRGPAELALAVSGPDRREVKVPHSTPGKIPNPSFDLGKMKEWVVSYEEDATDPTAVWRILHLRPSEEPRKVPDQIQPRKMELEMARRVEYPRQSNLDSTQGKQWMGAPEGNFNPPPTGHSAVLSGWGQNQLPPACLVSPNLNHLNPSHGPELAKQCSQYPRELRNQFQFQDQSKQWDPNPSNKRVLSVSTVDDDYSYFNNMKIEQLEQTKVKANLCSVEYQPRRVPGKEILEQEVYGIDPYTHNLPKEIVPADLDWSIDDKAEEKQGVNESGDEDKINKDIAVKTNFVMANVPDDRWLWSTRLLWKPPPWPDFCAMGCDSVAQHGGNEVLVNFHSVKKYHISLDKAFEFNDYCRSHQPPISLIKAEVCGLFGSVFCDFGPEITILVVDGEDPHIGITDNPALVSCDDDEADFLMKQDAFLYNLGAQMLPKSYHCFSRRLMLEYSKFSSLDSDELFACKLNNPKHRDTYKQVNVHVLNYEAILWEKLPKFSMQQLHFVGLLWNLPPWPDLSFCKVYWMSMGMEMGAGTVSKRNAYDVVAGQSKNQFQPTRNKQLTDFMKEWVAMVEQYKLKDSKWSSDLYSCRKQWAPGYVNHSGRDGTSAIKKFEKPDPYFDGAVEIGGVRLGQVRNLLGRITYDFKSCAWKSGVSNSTSQWPKVTQIDIQKYTKVFGDMDRDRDGKITGAEAHTLFLSWRLPREVLKQVWVLSDQDNDGLPSTAYNVPSWQPNPGLPHKGPGAPGVPAGGMWPPLPPHLHSQIDGATRPGQPRSHIPGMVNHAAAQASKDDQSGMNSAVQEEADAPKKVEEEKQIINSIERLEYYRTKMQDLVLYKSRCDNRLNEITERALKAQNILKSLLRGLTIAARSDKYIYSSGTASNECSSDLQGEDIKYESYAPRSTSLNTVSTIDLQKPIDHSLKDGILHLDAGAGLKMEEFWKIEIGSYRSEGEYFGPSDASTASSSATDNRRVEKVPIGIGKMELPDWAIDVTNLMNWDKGHSIIREMLDGGISLEVVTYDSIIDGMCKAQSMDKVEMLFNRMSRYVVMGDCTTHTTLVPGYYLLSILANYPVLASAPKEKGFSGFMIDVLMGGVSTAASQTAATPIERVKLLIQNQSELIKSVKLFNPYKSNGDCLARIYKETTASACSTLRKTRLATGSGLLEILLLEVLLMSAHSSLSISYTMLVIVRLLSPRLLRRVDFTYLVWELLSTVYGNPCWI